ncbi:MAG: hypothetical protein K0R76_1675 [Alphaproteobacteria bacterium]|nr:hypothetical protein [Alphaproteobacteria bacterium]
MNTGKIMGLIVGSLLASEEAAQAKFDGFYAGMPSKTQRIRIRMSIAQQPDADYRQLNFSWDGEKSLRNVFMED